MTHLIRPTADSPKFAQAEGLAPFRQWIRLTNADTYICGPFNFALINNRQTRDRVPLEQWQILHKFRHMFTTEVPSLDLPTYSIHLGQFHSTYHCPEHDARVSAYLTHPSDLDSV